MKRSTVNSSMRRTTRIITLMLIITVAVGLLLLGSITVDAATYDYDYIACLTDANGISRVYISNAPIHAFSSSSNATSSSYGFMGIGSITNNQIIELVYNTSTNDWQTYRFITVESGNSILYIFGTSTKYVLPNYVMIDSQSNNANNIYQKYSIITNTEMVASEQIFFTAYSNDLNQLPQGLTESAIRDIIDSQINTSTQSGQTAQTIINNTTTQYNLYLSGDINSTTMQQNVKSNIDTLSALTPGTLLDAMQINNGLTYNQTIQDQLLNTASGNVQTMINGYQNTINNAITNYQNGTTSQQDTVTTINQTITNLNNLIINGTAKTTADINAVNAAINSANANLDSVTDYKDLSQEVSEKVQQSDQEELDYLDELEAETTSTIEQLAPSRNFTGGQTGDAQEVLELVWENEFVKRLLPMCAGFMVVCVVLGIRYKV